MTNKEKYDNIFVEVFNVNPDQLGPEFNKQNVPEWDSVHQLNIMVLLEEAFDIMLDPEDIVALTSYENGLEVLRKFEVEI